MKRLLGRLVLFVLGLSTSAVLLAAAPPQRPIELADALAWRFISSPTLSDDGVWFGHRIGPQEGDSEVVFQKTSGDTQWKFGVGEAPARGAAPGGVVFSRSRPFAAFLMYPTRAEAAQLRRQRKPLQTRVGIVNLTTGAKVEVSRVRAFAFSGERGDWIALHKHGPDAPAGAMPGRGGAAARAAPTPAGGGDDASKGSDLLVRELLTGQELNLGNTAEFAFDRQGRYLAWTVDTQDKSGNGVQLRDMETGAIRSLDSDDKARYSRLSWNEEGDGLTVLKGVTAGAGEDPTFSVVAYDKFGAGGPTKTVFAPGAGFPAGMGVSPDRTPAWTKDQSALLFGIRSLRAKEGRADAARADDADADDKVDLVVWHWRDKRLQSQQQVQETQDKAFSYLAAYRPGDKTFVRLADDQLRSVVPAPGQRFAIGYDDGAYELGGSLDGRRFEDLYVVDVATGKRTLVAKKLPRWPNSMSPAGTHFLYYDDGHFHTVDMATGQATNITKGVATSFVDTRQDLPVVKPPVPPFGWSADGRFVLLSDQWDIWKVPVGGGAGVNLTLDGRKQQVRYRAPVNFDPDQRGFDLSKPLYVDVYGEWTKKNGIGVIDPGAPGVRRLTWDDASYGVNASYGQFITKARKADLYLFTRQTHKDAPEFYVADASLKDPRKLTDIGKGAEQFRWSSGAQLVDYVSAKGDKLQGALFLPADYEKGKTYPLIVRLYERQSHILNQYFPPVANGFNKSVYASRGYAVLYPDIAYTLNDPGMSAVFCIVPAIKAAIATGIVDPKRIGVTGQSWGAYQAAVLIAHTDLFAAAVAAAPLSDMISMYSLIYKNNGTSNTAMFETSQGRMTTAPSENVEAYVRNSPVFAAKNVKTPLLIVHNDRDGAVDFTQGVELYNTLRRLQKPVVMLQYPGENHNLSRRGNLKDYTVRMQEFFDHFLMGKPAPDWWVDGVPRLEMADHLKKRQAGESAETRSADKPRQ